ncbi:MAG: hypothetical protein JSV44_07870 [Candidatus Zixiibacteriota bacterium]|nr:MAG: hypothetical protein JSV44_07870 [candidate division Zixibacteria bacterium]
MDKDIIPPGDSAGIEVVFNTFRYEGPIVKHPLIITNAEPVDGDFYLEISSHVLFFPDSAYPLVISPFRLDLSDLNNPLTDSLVFEIKNVSPLWVHLEIVEFPQELVALSLPAFIRPGRSAGGVVRLTESGVGQVFEKSMTIELRDENHTRYTIPLKRTLL